MRQLTAYDTVIQAIAGIMDATGEADGGPTQCRDQLIATCVGNNHLFSALAQTLGKPDWWPTRQRYSA